MEAAVPALCPGVDAQPRVITGIEHLGLVSLSHGVPQPKAWPCGAQWHSPPRPAEPAVPSTPWMGTRVGTGSTAPALKPRGSWSHGGQWTWAIAMLWQLWW